MCKPISGQDKVLSRTDLPLAAGRSSLATRPFLIRAGAVTTVPTLEVSFKQVFVCRLSFRCLLSGLLSFGSWIKLLILFNHGSICDLFQPTAISGCSRGHRVPRGSDLPLAQEDRLRAINGTLILPSSEQEAEAASDRKHTASAFKRRHLPHVGYLY